MLPCTVPRWCWLLQHWLCFTYLGVLSALFGVLACCFPGSAVVVFCRICVRPKRCYHFLGWRTAVLGLLARAYLFPAGLAGWEY